MYHRIGDHVETGRHPYFKTVTSPARFEQQMQWLAEAGAEVVALDKWNSPFAGKRTLRVIITFDDGFADFMTNALPVLRNHNYHATMFLPTAFIGTGKELLTGVKHLEWTDVRQLIAAGIGIGSHTVTHRHIDTLSPVEIDQEIGLSAETIQHNCGGKVTAFSCPYAFPQAHLAVISALCGSLVKYGYSVGVTTKIGTVSVNDDPYTLKRIPINSDDDKKLFLAKLNGAYNWLAGIQRMVRTAKKILRR
jgi:peptidoglycan/xylan/chitin deacetylase (PgdA/CDA1 family)